MHNLKVLKLKFELPGKFQLGFEELFHEAEKVTTLSSLLFTPERFILVQKVEWRDEPHPELLRAMEIVDDCIEASDSGDDSIYIVEGHTTEVFTGMLTDLMKTYKCFLSFPIINVKGFMTIPLVGTRENLNQFIPILDDFDLKPEILSVTNYFVTGTDLLSSLTDPQYKCLELAYTKGYYDLPKKTDLRALAKLRSISHSAFLTHIRRAERKILKGLLE